MIEVKIDHPEFPKDMEFDLGGILALNGKAVKLDEDAELAFVARHRQSVKDKLANNEYITVSGTAKYGPSEVEKMFPEPDTEQPELDDVVAPEPISVGGES
jgi:hypothetical protein